MRSNFSTSSDITPLSRFSSFLRDTSLLPSSSFLQSFIRARNVIRTSPPPPSPNLSQKLLLLVMKLTVDRHASSFLGTLVTSTTDRFHQFFLHFSLDNGDFKNETLHPRTFTYLTITIFNKRRKLYTIFFLFSFIPILYVFFFCQPTWKRMKIEKERKNSKYIKIRWKKLFQVKGISRSSWLDRKCTKTFYTSVVSLGTGKGNILLICFFFSLLFFLLYHKKISLKKIENHIKSIEISFFFVHRSKLTKTYKIWRERRESLWWIMRR